jgi:hypothetical protein
MQGVETGAIPQVSPLLFEVCVCARACTHIHLYIVLRIFLFNTGEKFVPFPFSYFQSLLPHLTHMFFSSFILIFCKVH